MHARRLFFAVSLLTLAWTATARAVDLLKVDEDAYLKLLPEEQARPEQKAKYEDALAKLNGWRKTQMDA